MLESELLGNLPLWQVCGRTGWQISSLRAMADRTPSDLEILPHPNSVGIPSSSWTIYDALTTWPFYPTSLPNGSECWVARRPARSESPESERSFPSQLAYVVDPVLTLVFVQL